MGILNYQQPIAKNVQMIDAFGGLNKHFRISENEFSDILNMTADDYPVLSTRKKRKILKYKSDTDDDILSAVPSDTVSVVMVDNEPAILQYDGTFIFNKNKIRTGAVDNRMLRMGNMLYIWPEGIVVHLPKDDNGEVTVELTRQFLEVSKPDDGEYADGRIDVDGKAFGVISFQPSVTEAIGNTLTSFFEPSEPEIGDYWLDVSQTPNVLKRYNGSDNGWVSVVPSLIRMSVVRENNETYINDNGELEYLPLSTIWLKELFGVGDVVFLSGITIDGDDDSSAALNASFYVEAVGNDDDSAVYLAGAVDTFMISTAGRIEKKMPLVDHVVEHNGRLWACRYGFNTEGEFVNEIYASSPNSPTSWFRFQGTSQDSYALSLASEGKFTGAAVVNGYVTFFKEKYMHRIYGTLPESFQLYTVNCNGIQEGCENSLVSCNGVYYFKSAVGVMAMSDGLPVKISDALGEDVYKSAISGTDGSKYYIMMKDNNEESKIYVYDISTGIWHTEECKDELVLFFNYRNGLYALVCQSEKTVRERIAELEMLIATSNNAIITAVAKAQIAVLQSIINKEVPPVCDVVCFSQSSKIELPKYFNGNIANEYEPYFEEEKSFEWFAETGDIGYSNYGKKYLNKIVCRMQISPCSRTDIFVKYNYSDEWIQLSTESCDSLTPKSCFVTFRPVRCDSFRLRFSGKGDVKIMNFTQIYEEGTEI